VSQRERWRCTWARWWHFLSLLVGGCRCLRSSGVGPRHVSESWGS
jgi:hypothetical protein